MNVTKIGIVVLVVLAVLFGAVLFTAPRQQSNASADTFSAKQYPMLGSLNNVLAPFAPKVSAKSLVPLTQTFDLGQTAAYEASVLPDADKKFRQLAFTATPSKACAQVTYTPSSTGALDQVETSDKAGSSDHPERFSFILSASGGHLDVKRAAGFKEGGLCVLTLQVAP